MRRSHWLTSPFQILNSPQKKWKHRSAISTSDIYCDLQVHFKSRLTFISDRPNVMTWKLYFSVGIQHIGKLTVTGIPDPIESGHGCKVQTAF